MLSCNCLRISGRPLKQCHRMQVSLFRAVKQWLLVQLCLLAAVLGSTFRLESTESELRRWPEEKVRALWATLNWAPPQVCFTPFGALAARWREIVTNLPAAVIRCGKASWKFG